MKNHYLYYYLQLKETFRKNFFNSIDLLNLFEVILDPKLITNVEEKGSSILLGLGIKNVWKVGQYQGFHTILLVVLPLSLALGPCFGMKWKITFFIVEGWLNIWLLSDLWLWTQGLGLSSNCKATTTTREGFKNSCSVN